MDDVTLYHIWPSLCSQKVRLVLAEKGVPYTSRVVNIGPAMENYEPWYVRMNPSAVVPTLEHGERVVTDSMQISRYVDEAFPGPALMPEDAERRAHAERLLAQIDALQIRTISYAPRRAWLRGLLHKMVGMRERRLRKLAAANPDLREAYERKLADVQSWRRDVLRPEVAEAARREVIDALAALDDALADSGGPCILGASYTLVDAYGTVLVARVHMLGRTDVLEPFERLRAWYATMRERPSYAGAAIAERIEPSRMAPIVLPWLLPRLAVATAAIGLVVWGVLRLRA